MSAIISIFFLTNQRKLVSEELVGRTDRQFTVDSRDQCRHGHYAGDDHLEAIIAGDATRAGT